MTKRVIYKYLGTNGVIESPVFLEDIYFVRLFHLTADNKKILTNGERRVKTVRIPENEFENWKEIDE